MAQPGIGYRTALDILMEISFHLLQPTVATTMTAAPILAGYGDGGYGDLGFGGGTYYVLTLGSVTGCYVGADIVVGWGLTTAEVVQVLFVDPTNNTITVLLVNAHSNGETVLGPTFPIQEGTDPIFTQSEMLAYLARAQNEFLAAVPCYYERFFQTVNTGVIYQDTPNTAILVERIAASTMNLPILSLTRSGNAVTAVFAQQPPLSVGSTFAVVNATDSSYDGVFAVTGTNYSSSGSGFGTGGFGVGGGGGYAITYTQIGTDGNTTGGTIQSMLRLYETTQEELAMADRFWQSNYTAELDSWFEDRTGLYKWGVGGRPSTNFPVELLCAVRDTDTLGLLDGFLVPDMVLHGVKYLAMAYAYSKDGVMMQPQMAEFCLRRYAQVVAATQRYIAQMKMEVANA